MKTLNKELVQEIYTSTKTPKGLMEMYGISKSRISSIRNDKMYTKYTSMLEKPVRPKINRNDMLAKEQVIDIYYSEDKRKDLAKRYNVHPITISRIKNGTNYTEITDELDYNECNDIGKNIDRLDVIDIYYDTRPVYDIADEYGVTPTTIYNIINKRTHKDVTDELDEDF
ncbi:hypothetical protein CF5_0050 [Staphylococcus phage CF5]|uniref:Uncharacterized protein n=1 Tax=Staphylococcus phage CF5 TaxID=3113739 RepID=A0AAX4J7J0_9CAUD|nr:hypothetical protein CF5_0050 [Staphylococcus phage CF5]